VFVCYAHSDADTVYADLVELDRNGVNIWYDEGIPAGSSWRGEIAAAIKSADRLIYFISQASLKSSHCLREVDYAITHDIEIIPVYLEEIELPGELELVLNRVHGLFREKDSRYMEHLLGALQGGGGLAMRQPGRRRKQVKPWLPLALVAVAALAVLYWSPWDRPERAGEPVARVQSDPNAYDRYLEGLGLLERWDQDDNLDQAIARFTMAAELDQDFALAHARLADALRIRYALTGDEAWLEQATAEVNEAVRLNADLGPVQVVLGRVHASQGNFDLATAALERALAIDPNDATANQSLAGVYARLGRPLDAEAYYKRAIALDADNPRVRDSYANFLADQGRPEEAIKEWQAVIRVAPDHFAARVNMGSVLGDVGRWAEAIEMYKQANAIRPSYMAYSNLGTAYSRSFRYPEAVEAYRKALELNDSDWLAWGNLAYVYSWMDGMEAEAAQTFATAIELAEAAKRQDPRDPWVHSDLALYYAKTGERERALQQLDTVLVLAPDSGEIRAAAAEAFELLGERERAVEQVRAALAAGFDRGNLQRNPELSGILEDPGLAIEP
jgi:tetratricopeptide (TPR) repeat protein